MASGVALALRYGGVGLVSLAGSAVLIRHLGPAGWATYGVAYFLVVSLDQTVGSRLLGEVVRTSSVDDATLRAGARLVLVAGLTSLLLFGLGGLVLEGRTDLPELGQAMLAVGACALLYALRVTPLVLLEREMRFRLVAFAEVLEHLLFYALAIVLAVGAGWGLTGVLVALAIRPLPTVVLLRAIQRAPAWGRRDANRFRVVARFAAPVLVSGLIAMAEGLVPVFLLAGAHADELAFVITSATLIGYAAVVQFVAQRISFPALAGVSRGGRALDRPVARALSLSAWLVGTMVVPIAGTSAAWLPALFGTEWEAASKVMVGMGLAFALNAPLQVLSAALYALGAPRTVLAVNVASIVVFVALAVPLVAHDPLTGIPAAFAAARLLAVLAAVAAGRRRGLSFPWVGPIAFLLAGTGVSALMTAFLLDGRPGSAAAVAAGAALVWLPSAVRRRETVGRLARSSRRDDPQPD